MQRCITGNFIRLVVIDAIVFTAHARWLVILLLTLTSPCDRLWSAETDPFVGNWRSRNGEMRFVVENGQLRMEAKMILRDGNSRTVVVIYQFDGQEHPSEVSGETKHRKHSILWKRIHDHTVERRTDHDDGKEFSTDRLSSRRTGGN